MMRKRSSRHIPWAAGELGPLSQFVDEQPLLTGKQELALGKAVHAWKEIEKLRSSLAKGKNVQFSDDELAKRLGCSREVLTKIRQRGEYAKMKLINSNLKLVLAMASRYRSSLISLSELMSEGVLGLSKAVIRYDYTQGYRFSTFATWYIFEGIQREMKARMNVVKVPNDVMKLSSKLTKFVKAFSSEHGRSPSLTEMMAATGASAFELQRAIKMRFPVTPIHSPFMASGGYDGVWADRVASDLGAGKEATAKNRREGAILAMFAARLTEKEVKVLCWRLGLEWPESLVDADDDDEMRRLRVTQEGQSEPLGITKVMRMLKLSKKELILTEQSALAKISSCDELKSLLGDQQL